MMTASSTIGTTMKSRSRTGNIAPRLTRRQAAGFPSRILSSDMATRRASASAARTASRRRYFHGGPLSMIVLAGTLAVVAALVATVVYAKVDAGRKIGGDPNAAPRLAPITTVADDGPTTTRVEILSPD